MSIGFKEQVDSATENRSAEVVDSLEQVEEPSPENKKNITLIIIVAIAVILIIAMLKSVFRKEPTIEIADNNVIDTAVTTTEFNTTTTEASTQEDMEIGLPQYNPRENGQTSATVYSPNDYIKDLNGSDIPAVYSVIDRSYKVDFVNYEAKRAIITDGMEMYWLEILYKNKQYRCQIPFYIYKDLEATGICAVEIEVLSLEGGGQIISYMQVVTDYSKLSK